MGLVLHCSVSQNACIYDNINDNFFLLILNSYHFNQKLVAQKELKINIQR